MANLSLYPSSVTSASTDEAKASLNSYFSDSPGTGNNAQSQLQSTLSYQDHANSEVDFNTAAAVAASNMFNTYSSVIQNMAPPSLFDLGSTHSFPPNVNHSGCMLPDSDHTESLTSEMDRSLGNSCSQFGHNLVRSAFNGIESQVGPLVTGPTSNDLSAAAAAVAVAAWSVDRKNILSHSVECDSSVEEQSAKKEIQTRWQLHTQATPVCVTDPLLRDSSTVANTLYSSSLSLGEQGNSVGPSQSSYESGFKTYPVKLENDNKFFDFEMSRPSLSLQSLDIKEQRPEISNIPQSESSSDTLPTTALSSINFISPPPLTDCFGLNLVIPEMSRGTDTLKAQHSQTACGSSTGGDNTDRGHSMLSGAKYLPYVSSQNACSSYITAPPASAVIDPTGNTGSEFNDFRCFEQDKTRVNGNSDVRNTLSSMPFVTAFQPGLSRSAASGVRDLTTAAAAAVATGMTGRSGFCWSTFSDSSSTINRTISKLAR